MSLFIRAEQHAAAGLWSLASPVSSSTAFSVLLTAKQEGYWSPSMHMLFKRHDIEYNTTEQVHLALGFSVVND